jgi:hypothetical protein
MAVGRDDVPGTTSFGAGSTGSTFAAIGSQLLTVCWHVCSRALEGLRSEPGAPPPAVSLNICHGVISVGTFASAPLELRLTIRFGRGWARLRHALQAESWHQKQRRQLAVRPSQARGDAIERPSSGNWGRLFSWHVRRSAPQAPDFKPSSRSLTSLAHSRRAPTNWWQLGGVPPTCNLDKETGQWCGGDGTAGPPPIADNSAACRHYVRRTRGRDGGVGVRPPAGPNQFIRRCGAAPRPRERRRLQGDRTLPPGPKPLSVRRGHA